MNYPYSTSTGSIPKILEKLQSVGKPQTVDKTWFSSIGFTKDSEQRMIFVLKFINFIDETGAPTQNWTEFRSTKMGRKTLATAIKQGYNELYEVYPNAHECSKEDLKHFFSTRTDAGDLVLSHTVNTFVNLAEFADFRDLDGTKKTQTKIEKTSEKIDLKEKTTTIKAEQISPDNLKKDVVINVNIQLTLPETTDEKVYQKFFEAMNKYLLS